METFAAPEGEPSANAVDCLNVHRWADEVLVWQRYADGVPDFSFLMRCGLRAFWRGSAAPE
jgi:hypothetical protein